MWKKINRKARPGKRHDCLVAYRPVGSSPRYEVLSHWPDGDWTDTLENPIEPDEMPEYWMDIPVGNLHSVWEVV